MNEQKQIEEMADVMYGVEAFELEVLAEALYNAGYRKIPEGAVVLTREEHQKYLAFKIIEPQVRGCLDRERELEKRLETAIKETAEKFAERLKAKLTDIIPFEDYEVADWNYDGMDIENSIDEICEEVKGWNNE